MPDPLTFSHAMLRPGARVAAHSEGWLQVGLHSPGATLLPDTPAVRGLLTALSDAAWLGTPSPELTPVWQKLHAAGLLVDADAYFKQLANDSEARAARSAVFAEHPDDAAARLRARGQLGVEVEADVLGDQARRLLELAGVRQHPQPAVKLIISAGEPRRSRLDDAIRESLPHLVLRQSEDRVLLGPFVVPGATACLRCLDLHESAGEPRRPLIIEQYAAHASDSSPVASPINHARMTAALGWAVEDIAVYLDGGEPTTWSSVAVLDGQRRLEPRYVPRHPHCGCSWSGVMAG